HEFLHSRHTADCLVLEANSAAYGRAAPYLPAIELLRFYFKINTYDFPQSIREKVLSKISRLDASLQEAIPPVLDLLDALENEHPFWSLDPIQHRQYTHQAFSQIFLCESRVRPIVLVVEDLHWIDPLTLGLINELVVRAQ